jgi:hypothetical protein
MIISGSGQVLAKVPKTSININVYQFLDLINSSVYRMTRELSPIQGLAQETGLHV